MDHRGTTLMDGKAVYAHLNTVVQEGESLVESGKSLAGWRRAHSSFLASFVRKDMCRVEAPQIDI